MENRIKHVSTAIWSHTLTHPTSLYNQNAFSSITQHLWVNPHCTSAYYSNMSTIPDTANTNLNCYCNRHFISLNTNRLSASNRNFTIFIGSTPLITLQLNQVKSKNNIKKTLPILPGKPFFFFLFFWLVSPTIMFILLYCFLLSLNSLMRLDPKKRSLFRTFNVCSA